LDVLLSHGQPCCLLLHRAALLLLECCLHFATLARCLDSFPCCLTHCHAPLLCLPSTRPECGSDSITAHHYSDMAPSEFTSELALGDEQQEAHHGESQDQQQPGR